jgi:hypothetical protein
MGINITDTSSRESFCHDAVVSRVLACSGYHRGVRGTCPLVVLGLALTAGVARAQDAANVNSSPAAVRTSFSAADPDPTAEQPQLGMRALPLESRTDLLENVGRDTPGVLWLEDGVGISGGTAEETHLMLDGLRVSRLSAPLGMLSTGQVHRAGYGAPLADVTGGAVAGFTRPDSDRWRASLDSFQDRREPRAETVGVTAAGPVLKRRLHLLIGLQLGRERFEPTRDPEAILPDTPAIEGPDGRVGLKLSFTPRPGQRLELLALGTMASQENAPELGRGKDSQPRWEDSYGLLAARWGGQFGQSWLARAHLALEGSGTRLFPKLCLTQPNCYEIPIMLNRFPRQVQSGNYELRSEYHQRSAETQLSVQRALPDRFRTQWAVRAGSRLQLGWRERVWQVPGNELNEWLGTLPGSRTSYYANDPRLEPPLTGPVRTSWDTLRAVQFVELPIRAFSRLHVLPGVGLVTARGQFGEQRPASTALTHDLAAEFDAYPPWGLSVRASTHRRADANLDALDGLIAVSPVSRRCLWNTDTQAFDRECFYSGGRRTSLGLVCSPSGINADGAPCRQALGMPRTWEHTLGAGMDLGLGLRLDMDVIERRTSGMWARLETNRVWNIVGREASFQGYRNGRAEPLFDVSAPDGPSRKYRALTTTLQRPVGAATVFLAHTFSRTRVPLHALPGLVIVDDDGGRHFVHLQSILNLGGFASIGVRYRYAQGERMLPLFPNTVTGYEPFRVSGRQAFRPGSDVPPNTTLRQPSISELSLQLRVSLRRLIRVADAQFYADALNILHGDEPSRRSRFSDQFGVGVGMPPEEWFRFGLQAGF